MQQHDPISLFIAPLEKSGIAYFVTGSIATIYYGEPRLTHDIDVVIHLPPTDVIKLENIFPLQQYYCPPTEVIEIERKRQPYGHFNLIHHTSGWKADIYPSSNDALSAWAFEHRKKANMGGGTLAWVAPPEYIILRKLEFFREGGSQKHLDDIKKMLPQIHADLNIPFLEQELKTRGLENFWEQLK